MNLKFTDGTPMAVQALLSSLVLTDKTVRLIYGDCDTGADWLEESDVVGTIGHSTGVAIPLICREGAGYGSAVLTNCILRVIDVSTGADLYRHEKYSEPQLQIVGVPTGFEIQNLIGQTIAFYSSKRGATRWLNFITGRRSTR